MTDRYRPSRRSALRTLGTLGVAVSPGIGTAGARGARPNGEPCSGRPSTSPPPTRRRLETDVDDPTKGATRYVATVDRIVDGERVVVLLESDGEPVAQRVVAADAHDDLEEGDILLALVTDDELLAYRIVPERPSGGVPS